MRIDRDAAAVVADRDRVVFVQLDFDPGGVARNGLVHRVVQNLGHKMVQRPFVGAADIHAGTFANRFEPFENLDGMGVVVAGCSGEEVVHTAALIRFVAGEYGRAAWKGEECLRSARLAFFQVRCPSHGGNTPGKQGISPFSRTPHRRPSARRARPKCEKKVLPTNRWETHERRLSG